VRATWRLLAAHRDLRLLLSAGLTSLAGDWILRIGLAYRVYALTGSTVASALTMASSFLPQLLLGALGGVFADRWDRRRTMIVADLLLAAGLLPLLLVHGAGQVWLVFVVLLWEGVVAQFFSPAEQAMLPTLVPDDALVTANAAGGQVQNLSRLAGSAAGGVIATVGGIGAVALADAASFVLSAALIALIRVPARSSRGAAASASIGSSIAAVRGELIDGLRQSVRHRVVRALTGFILVTAIGEGIMSTLFAPFVRHVLHGSSQAYGIVAAVQAVGGLLGGLLAASVGHRVSPAKLLGWGAVAFGTVDLAIFLYPLGYVAVWPAAVGMIVVGLPGALSLAGAITLFQRNTEDAYRGRVFGALNAVEGIAILAGTAGAGLLGQAIGIVPVLAVQGGGYVVAGLAMLVALRAETQTTLRPTRDLISYHRVCQSLRQCRTPRRSEGRDAAHGASTSRAERGHAA
jgi:Na+/melibiose symporter-like transporter